MLRHYILTNGNENIRKCVPTNSSFRTNDRKLLQNSFSIIQFSHSQRNLQIRNNVYIK